VQGVVARVRHADIERSEHFQRLADAIWPDLNGTALQRDMAFAERVMRPVLKDTMPPAVCPVSCIARYASTAVRNQHRV
jgi:hypothetical protein